MESANSATTDTSNQQPSSVLPAARSTRNSKDRSVSAKQASVSTEVDNALTAQSLQAPSSRRDTAFSVPTARSLSTMIVASAQLAKL